jgi:hypothetical protein
MDAIENARASLAASTTQFLDMTIGVSSSWAADTWIMITTFKIDFWLRTTAGNR